MKLMIVKDMNKVVNKISDRQRRSLFYLFKSMKFNDDMRHDFILDYTNGRTDSLKELDYIEAQEMIRYLQELGRTPQTRKYKSESDRLRKGVIKAIGQYFEDSGMNVSLDYIKSTAIRAAGIVPTGFVSHDFNRIPETTLTRIYNEFCRKQSVIRVKDRIPKIGLN